MHFECQTISLPTEYFFFFALHSSVRNEENKKKKLNKIMKLWMYVCEPYFMIVITKTDVTSNLDCFIKVCLLPRPSVQSTARIINRTALYRPLNYAYVRIFSCWKIVIVFQNETKSREKAQKKEGNMYYLE